MPLPSFLISANLLICERVLVEKDEAASAIRMVDVFHVPAPPPGIEDLKAGDPAPAGATVIKTYALTILKAIAGHTDTHQLQIRVFDVTGEWTFMHEMSLPFCLRGA